MAPGKARWLFSLHENSRSRRTAKGRSPTGHRPQSITNDSSQNPQRGLDTSASIRERSATWGIFL
jgi:hypothetical protein